MRRVCSRPLVHLVIVQNLLSWPERTVCVNREARYRKWCIAQEKVVGLLGRYPKRHLLSPKS